MENHHLKTGRTPGVFLPWDEERKRIPQITGDETIVRKFGKTPIVLPGLLFGIFWFHFNANPLTFNFFIIKSFTRAS